MLIEARNTVTRIVSATPEEQAFAQMFLSFEDNSKKFYRSGGQTRTRSKANMRMSLLDPFSNEFPTGVLAMLRRTAQEQGITVQIADRRVRPCEPDATADVSWLRDYQRDAIDIGIRRTRGILWHPTGAGKAEVIVGMARALPCTWLVFAPESALMHNVADRWEGKTNLPAGRIGDGCRTIERFTACTFQSFAAAIRRNDADMIKLLESAEAIFVDEVHTLPADSYYHVAMRCKSAYWRFGCSGTPLARGDRKSTFAVASLGEIIHRVKQEELVGRGLLAKPVISMIPLSQCGTSSDYQKAYGELIVRSRARNKLIIDCVQRVDKPALLFVREIDHGRDLKHMLERAGLTVEFAFGDVSTEQRARMIAALERGALDVIVCSVVMQTGINIPSLRGMVIAAGGKSVIAAIQRIGRGTRVVPGKDTFQVIDVLDQDAGMPGVSSMPSAGRWPARHARDRQAAYIREGYEVRVLDPLQAVLRGVG